ncbi:uncharacterized protein LOC133825668 [Humulus lupulus]|uniref:uncharacterized protein LOC133825668 n=1 Tax=Humulus lupulus TaxID=3486 RepID=UPI002B40D3F5|nr:uncharacterized protein LOC133825668 [Humulus lupulus]
MKRCVGETERGQRLDGERRIVRSATTKGVDGGLENVARWCGGAVMQRQSLLGGDGGALGATGEPTQQDGFGVLDDGGSTVGGDRPSASEDGEDTGTDGGDGVGSVEGDGAGASDDGGGIDTDGAGDTGSNDDGGTDTYDARDKRKLNTISFLFCECDHQIISLVLDSGGTVGGNEAGTSDDGEDTGINGASDDGAGDTDSIGDDGAEVSDDGGCKGTDGAGGTGSVGDDGGAGAWDDGGAGDTTMGGDGVGALEDSGGGNLVGLVGEVGVIGEGRVLRF